MTVLTLTDVMQKKQVFVRLRQWILAWKAILNGSVHVSLQKQLLQKRAHKLEWQRLTPVAVSEPHCATDVCNECTLSKH